MLQRQGHLQLISVFFFFIKYFGKIWSKPEFAFLNCTNLWLDCVGEEKKETCTCATCDQQRADLGSQDTQGVLCDDFSGSLQCFKQQKEQ